MAQPPKLFSDFNTLQLACVTSMVVFVILLFFMGVDHVNPADLPQKIVDRLKDHDTERKVYIVADIRTRWDQ